jgi:hypothetical protein
MKEKFPSKKPLRLAAVIVAALAVLGGILALILSSCGGPKAYAGYLVCQKCGLAGKCAEDNINLAVNPEKHTLKCDKMAGCVVSGFGIEVKQGGGYKYYRFDAGGSAMALDNVIYMTKKADNLLVEVRGTVKGNTIEVESIMEK